jgi:[CysO sulfur-carrier protein]-S-L-cysteine hydrolase
VIEIPRDIRDEMIEHAVAGLPNEACGFLAGSDGRVERFYPVRNEDESPSTYLMHSEDRFRAEEDIEKRGMRVLAVFHSHPGTQAYPSETDRERALWHDGLTGENLPVYPGTQYVIVSLKDRARPQLASFAIEEHGVRPHEVRIT